jgi:hypothetical protein
MKKVLFLMCVLFLMVSGTASLRAQVRIGGNGVPHETAVLDLNPDDNATHDNTGGLALPRVKLTASDMHLNGAVPVNGILVYNTDTSLEGAGVYVWINGKWGKVAIDTDAYAALTDNLPDTMEITPPAGWKIDRIGWSTGLRHNRKRWALEITRITFALVPPDTIEAGKVLYIDVPGINSDWACTVSWGQWGLEASPQFGAIRLRFNNKFTYMAGTWINCVH